MKTFLKIKFKHKLVGTERVINIEIREAQGIFFQCRVDFKTVGTVKNR